MLRRKTVEIRERRKNRQQRSLRRINMYSQKLRLSIFLSRKNILAQLIDDDKSITLCSFDTKHSAYQETKAKSYNTEGAKVAGQLAGKKFNTFIENNCSLYKGIYVDRGGKTYHCNFQTDGTKISGRMASFLDEIRAAVTKWSF